MGEKGGSRWWEALPWSPVVAMNLSAPTICAFSLFQRSLPPIQRGLAQLLAANVSLKEINQESPLMREMTK